MADDDVKDAPDQDAADGNLEAESGAKADDIAEGDQEKDAGGE